MPHAVVISSLEITLARPKSVTLIDASGSGEVYSKFSGFFKKIKKINSRRNRLKLCVGKQYFLPKIS